MGYEVFLALDILSAALSLFVAATFGRLWRSTRETFHLMLVIGFLFLGSSFLLSLSRFSLGLTGRAGFGMLIGGQVAGSLVILFAYLGVRRRVNPETWSRLGWAAVITAAVVMMSFLAVPYFADVPDLLFVVPYTASLQALIYAACAAMAFSGYVQLPALNRTFVPIAFLCLALEKYSLVMMSLSGSVSTLAIPYLWRLLALALFLLAIRFPRRDLGEDRAKA